MGAGGLVAKWTDRARRLREWAAAEEAARAWEAAARELQLALEGESEKLLNLQQASVASGYSPEHLGRLVRQGRIPNAGRLNAPRIRLGDLPRKPGRTGPDLSTRAPSRSRSAIVHQVLDGLRHGAGGRAA
jgi:hypothetical protein